MRLADRLLDRLADRIARRVVELNAAKRYGSTITVQQANVDALAAATEQQIKDLSRMIYRIT